ncbi:MULTISPECIES: DUF6913 domain-containing protein [unclassified Arenibacter]|jgi:hypothetical protein|uniref:DUF6913 domain-containing protein n=1 Tax=unclassified Arenibacter TaxID=2615047 RepID=UPI000E35214A|nr:MULTISPECIES: hypothetical protein [unclassified Arenibacter]MCM4163511.1 hypothetical protein [Arenibacter sp. A80]RFT57502.1 hypothetical protein D0S24_07850 [Arenibacter sp. P308M17]
MFLKALKEKIKFRAGKKLLKKGLNASPKIVDRAKGISAVGCIVDLDEFENTNAFDEFVEEFSLRHNALKIIGYKKYNDNNSPYSTPVFSDKDLGWKGNIENSYALEFLNREYDLLVNYYTDDKLLLQLMTLNTKARLKVGFGSVDKSLNDLILNTPIEDFQTFKKELGKYLRVLNEIK